MWADTYHVNPFRVGVDALTPLTDNNEVDQTQVSPVPSMSSSDQGILSDNPHETPGTSFGVSKVSLLRDKELDTSATLTPERKTPMTIPYVIFNLALDRPLYIPKGAVIAHPINDEPEMDVIEIVETRKHKKICDTGINCQVNPDYLCHQSLT